MAENIINYDELKENTEKRTKILKAFETVINQNSLENGSNTPDFILAEYLVQCLEAFNKCSRHREQWFGKELKIGGQ